MAETPERRKVEPFVYFPTHASAISGLGGRDPSPDPNYCFHSHYHEYRPGVLLVHIRLAGARAKMGELAVRVHGYRPDHPEEGVVLVNGMRQPLDDLQGDDLDITLRIVAVPKVHYAVYGYFSEPSDLQAENVAIEAEEIGGGDVEFDVKGEVPHTALNMEKLISSAALVSAEPAQLRYPVSQCCTLAQLESTEFLDAYPKIPMDGGNMPGMIARWRQIYSLRVLESYGVLEAGARGLALGALPDGMAAALRRRDCIVAHAFTGENAQKESIAESIGFFDFIVGTDCSEIIPLHGNVQSLINTVIKKLNIGGIAILIMNYCRDDECETSPPDRNVINRGTLEKMALNLIGRGHQVCQLNFPVNHDRDLDTDIVPFGFIVQR